MTHLFDNLLKKIVEIRFYAAFASDFGPLYWEQIREKRFVWHDIGKKQEWVTYYVSLEVFYLGTKVFKLLDFCTPLISDPHSWESSFSFWFQCFSMRFHCEKKPQNSIFFELFLSIWSLIFTLELFSRRIHILRSVNGNPQSIVFHGLAAITDYRFSHSFLAGETWRWAVFSFLIFFHHLCQYVLKDKPQNGQASPLALGRDYSIPSFELWLSLKIFFSIFRRKCVRIDPFLISIFFQVFFIWCSYVWKIQKFWISVSIERQSFTFCF